MGPRFVGLVGDSRSALNARFNASVDVLVTSPPYKGKEGFSDTLIQESASVWRRVVKPDGLVYLNFGQLSEDPTRPMRVCLLMQSTGWALRQTIIWVKSLAVGGRTVGHFQPINSTRFVNYCHELIFVFEQAPGSGRPFNRLAVGVPYTDPGNLARGTRGKNGDCHCAGDVWFVPYATTGPGGKKAHKYEFPVEIPLKCLKLSGLFFEGTVLDPFMGSGSTGVAARLVGADFIGCDLEAANAHLAVRRWWATSEA